MVEIKRVDTLDAQTLDIELSNGHLILFDMNALPNDDPVLLWMRSRSSLPRPSTDGRCVCWSDGPSLSLKRILALIHDA